MIITTTINKLRTTKADLKYAIVQSYKNRERDILQMSILAPPQQLFYTYLHLRDVGQWNIEAFESMYVPTYIKYIAESDKAKRMLNELASLSKAGAVIALGCYCPNELLCHRSIDAGLFKGIGCEVYTDVAGDYIRYFEMYVQQYGGVSNANFH